jgi:hypothetical protein
MLTLCLGWLLCAVLVWLVVWVGSGEPKPPEGD